MQIFGGKGGTFAPLEIGSSAESDACDSERADTLCALGSVRKALKESCGVVVVRLRTESVASLLHGVKYGLQTSAVGMNVETVCCNL